MLRRSINPRFVDDEAPGLTAVVADFERRVEHSLRLPQVNPEYARLQATWNRRIIEEVFQAATARTSARDRLLSVGSFYGFAESALSLIYKSVLCADLENFLIDPPLNVGFVAANIDTAGWTLPDARYDCIMFVEMLEHLIWSPLPLLSWMRQHGERLFITTPDAKEWPDMKPHPWTRLSHFSDIPIAPPGETGNPNPMEHAKQYTVAEFVELLSTTGWRVERLSRVGAGGHQILLECT